MLELRDYTRSELIEIYKTNRLDAIKKKIKGKGYEYVDKGNGKNYIMTITNLPDQENMFKDYCVNTLKFAPQTDFKLLRAFLYNLIFDDTFKDLQFNEMVERLADQNITITTQTISKYFNKIKELGWIDYISLSADDYIYYVYDYTLKHNRYITAEEYNEAWRNYWKQVRVDKDKPYPFEAAYNAMLKEYNGKPKKRMKPLINGFYIDQMKTIENLLQ